MDSIIREFLPADHKILQKFTDITSLSYIKENLLSDFRLNFARSYNEIIAWGRFIRY